MSSTPSPFGIGVITFIIAVGVTIGYFQFSYLPYVTAKPDVPQEVLEPPEVTEVRIIEGSVNESQQDNFIPKRVEVQLGLDNLVRWTNEDTAPHTVTTDNGHVDQWSGLFDSLDTMGVIKPGETYEFLFTQEGEFPYHCEPHPWMRGTVKVTRLKF